MAQTQTETLAQLIRVLEPLSDEERLRTVRAALTFLGSDRIDSVGTSSSQGSSGRANGADDQESETQLPQRASRWLQQNGINFASLDNIFHFREGEVEIIAADVPGKDQKEKAQQCYLLSGIRSLLQDGNPRINDDQARELCREIGCYDNTNHARYVKSLGNYITGTKSSGYELTQPGLRAAADTIKAMVGG